MPRWPERIRRIPEPGIRASGKDNACPARSPGGWWCCLPIGHDGNHIGTTADFESLYQWPPADDPPEYDPDDAEAQRIAEACADASAEHDRIEAEEAGRG